MNQSREEYLCKRCGREIKIAMCEGCYRPVESCLCVPVHYEMNLSKDRRTQDNVNAPNWAITRL